REVEADGEALLLRRARGDARLERQRARAHPGRRPRREDERHRDHRGRDHERHHAVDQEGQPVTEHLRPPLYPALAASNQPLRPEPINNGTSGTNGGKNRSTERASTVTKSAGFIPTAERVATMGPWRSRSAPRPSSR